MRLVIAWMARLPWKQLARGCLVIYFIIMISISVAGIWLFPAYARNHADKFIPMNSWNCSSGASRVEPIRYGPPPYRLTWN